MDTTQMIVDTVKTAAVDTADTGLAVVNEALNTAASAHSWALDLNAKMLAHLPAIIATILILVLGKIFADVARNVAKKIMVRAKVDSTLIGFATNLGHITIMVFVVIAALGKLGFQTTSFVAVLGAAGLAIGLALQGSLSNFASGVLMIIFKPFKVGDFIDAGGVTGSVIEISIFTTILTTPDNKKVIVPNAKITGDNIVNFGANGTRRVDLSVGISYDDDMQKARELLMEMLKKDSRVLSDPAPLVAVKELGDSSVNLVVRPWCSAADYWDVHFDTMQSIKEVLDANELSIPFPQRDLHHYYPETPAAKAVSTGHSASVTKTKEEEGDE